MAKKDILRQKMINLAVKNFDKGVKAFEKNESRDAMYRVATYLIDNFWGNPKKMADAIGVLLLTWNQAFYRYGPFDFDALEKCIQKNRDILKRYRKRSITTLKEKDNKLISMLFLQFNEALQITTGKKKGSKSPVSVAKTLHLLAPNFFPLWDYNIALAYNCNYYTDPIDKYLEFCFITKDIAKRIKHPNNMALDKTIVRLIDEYNYAKYTKGWI